MFFLITHEIFRVICGQMLIVQGFAKLFKTLNIGYWLLTQQHNNNKLKGAKPLPMKQLRTFARASTE